MKDYPNEEALRKAHRIYLDTMRGFIHKCLESVLGTTPKELIMMALDCEPRDDFEVEIEINNIPHLIREYWDDCFRQKFDRHYDVRSATGRIKDGRNFWAHPGVGDVDPESTRMHLSLVAEVLDEINEANAKQAVEDIRDRLFSHEPEEHPAEVENVKLKERLADMSKQLEAAKVEKTELEKQVKTTLDRLEEVEAEWIACDERLATMSTRLTIAIAGKTTAEERLSDISNRLEERLQTSVKQLETANAVKTELEERYKTTSARLKDVAAELKVVKVELEKRPPEVIPKPLPLNTNMPDSITFHGTTFTKHFDQYYVEGDDITQTFWNYWHSQGQKGKEEMRDAGWSVEQVNGDWEVTVSSEGLQAWIVHEVTELNILLNSWQDEESSSQSTQLSATLRQSIPLSSEKTSLPTGEEMEQPALEFLSDRREHRRVEIIDYLSEHFSLTRDQRSYLSKTGKAEKHLVKNGLMERTRTGYYRITAHGLEEVEDIPF